MSISSDNFIKFINFRVIELFVAFRQPILDAHLVHLIFAVVVNCLLDEVKEVINSSIGIYTQAIIIQLS